MTTCADCLSALSTMRLSEIGPGSPIEQHYSTCENCSRIAADLQYAEHRLALALSELRPSYAPELVAQEAIVGSAKLSRRTVAKWVRGGLFLTAAIILGTYIAENRSVSPPIDTEMVILKCATADVATSIATPFLRSHGAAVYGGGDPHVITLRGVHREVETAISHIDQYEAQVCGAGGSPDLITSRTFLESEVNKPASLIPGTQGPRYPDVLRAAGVTGEVRAQFVVATNGFADMSTFKVLTKTDDRFEKAVRNSLPHMRFDAAEIAGTKVKQLVQQTFEFNLDR